MGANEQKTGVCGEGDERAAVVEHAKEEQWSNMRKRSSGRNMRKRSSGRTCERGAVVETCERGAVVEHAKELPRIVLQREMRNRFSGAGSLEFFFKVFFK